MTDIALLIISLLLISICGIFVAAEFSFVTVERSKVNKLASQGDKKANNIKLALSQLSTQLSGSQLGITLTSLLVGLLSEPVISRLIEDELTKIHIPHDFTTIFAVIMSISLATIITMVFGELIPKNIAITYPLQTAKFVVYFQRSFTTLMGYPLAMINWISNTILRLIGIKPKERLDTARSQEELISIVKHSAVKGKMSKNIASLIKSSLEFGQKNASEVMTPRVKVIYVSQNDSLLVVIEKSRHYGYSKFPVIDNNIDNVVGVIQLKDVFKITHSKRSSTKVDSLMQPTLYVPSSIELDDLLLNLHGRTAQIAIVIDEFGGTDGIVTAEDLTEELVGEVWDEHDSIDPVFQEINPNKWEVSGLLRPDEIGEITSVNLPEDEDYETIGGLIIDQLGKIPSNGNYTYINAYKQNGDYVTIKLTVSKMDGKRVDKLILEITGIVEQNNE